MANILCPKCKVEMRREIHAGTEVDVCPNCNGIFFDENEFSKLKDTNGITVSIREDSSSISTNIGEEKTLNCPKCGDHSVMDKHRYLDTDIIVDSCEICGGLWLDAGEFTALYEYAQSISDSKPDEELIQLLEQQKEELKAKNKKAFVGSSGITFRLLKKLFG